MERAINAKLNAPGLGTYRGRKNTCDQMRGAQGKALDDAARQTFKGSAYPSSARLGPKKGRHGRTACHRPIATNDRLGSNLPLRGRRREGPVSARFAHCPEPRRRSLDRTDSSHSTVAAATALHVKGFRTPASQWRDEMLGGRCPKSLRGGNRGGVCAGSGVGLWRFSLCMPRSLDIERGSRPSNHRGVGFGRRVQDRTVVL